MLNLGRVNQKKKESEECVESRNLQRQRSIVQNEEENGMNTYTAPCLTLWRVKGTVSLPLFLKREIKGFNLPTTGILVLILEN